MGFPPFSFVKEREVGAGGEWEAGGGDGGGMERESHIGVK